MIKHRKRSVLAIAGCTLVTALAVVPAASACGGILSPMTFSGTTLKWSGTDTCSHATKDQYIQRFENGAWRTVTTRTWKSTAPTFSMVHTVCFTGLGSYRAKGWFANGPFVGATIRITRYPSACL